MDELVKRIDPHFAYEWHETEDGILRVYVRSTRKDAQCPYCGSISKQVHSVYPWKFRDLPIQGMKVEVVIRSHKFYCPNAECGHKTFAESYECLPGMARRSRQLTQAIVHTAINTSSITASKMLGKGTADVGKSTIYRLLKKSEQIGERIDKSAPKVVCIDDFATKKRYTYGTVMVDAETGRSVDMLESRESTEVSEWLATYPNLKVVSRDGSQMYAKAIRTAHPDALQVSDRFHIFKGLAEAARQFSLIDVVHLLITIL